MLEEAFAKFIGQMLRAVSTSEYTEMWLSISVALWGQITSLPLPLGRRGARCWPPSAKAGCANALERKAPHACEAACASDPAHCSTLLMEAGPAVFVGRKWALTAHAIEAPGVNTWPHDG